MEVIKNKINNTSKAFAELERGVHAALETYSNVHRGSGHNSMVTTQLYEHARDIVLDYLGLSRRRYTVIFCSPRRASALAGQLEPGSCRVLSSRDIGLSLGIRALAVKRGALPKGIPFETGGGTARLISRGWVIWAHAPGKFEAGTPAIISVVAFAKALCMIRQAGNNIFTDATEEELSAREILQHDELDNYSGRELLEELRKTLVGRGISVPTLEGDKPFINLDNAASTPTFTPVWNTVCQVWRQPARVQQEVIREVSSICAGMLSAPPDTFDVIFTSNTTEAINLAAESMGLATEQDTEPAVLNTVIEHSSNDLPWRIVPRHSLVRVSADKEGFIDLKELDSLLKAYNGEFLFGKKRIRLVTVSGGSNVLGVCNNLADISRIVHKYGARLLVDAAQLVAHRKVDVDGCGIDYLAFSAHKVYAPFGCGVLVVKKGLLNFTSAEMDLIRSSGEENAGGIAALGKALVLLQRIGMDVIREEEQALTKRALLGLSQVPGIRIYGVEDPESPAFAGKVGVIVFTLKGAMAPKVAGELALRGGIGIRYGCHCAHLLVKHILGVGAGLERFQHILLTLFPKISLPGVARISIGLENTGEEIDTFIRVLNDISDKTRSRSNQTSPPPYGKTLLLPRRLVKRLVAAFTKDAVLRVYS
jgi:selenocysteine lyase/cysteine desulfurase